MQIREKVFLQPVYYQAKLCSDAENDITITFLMYYRTSKPKIFGQGLLGMYINGVMMLLLFNDFGLLTKSS